MDGPAKLPPPLLEEEEQHTHDHNYEVRVPSRRCCCTPVLLRLRGCASGGFTVCTCTCSVFGTLCHAVLRIDLTYPSLDIDFPKESSLF